MSLSLSLSHVPVCVTVPVSRRMAGIGLPFEDRQNASNWTHTITCRPDAETGTQKKNLDPYLNIKSVDIDFIAFFVLMSYRIRIKI